MSFVRLDTGEFPPLDKMSQQHNGTSKTDSSSGSKSKRKTASAKSNGTHQADYLKNEKSRLERFDNPKQEQINDSNDFIRCRVGLKLNEFQEDLEQALKDNYIGRRGDFLLAPIEPPKSWFEVKEFDVISDLVLPCEIWYSRIAIDLGYPTINHFDTTSAKYFDKLFRHALYLSTPVIVVTCPDTDFAYPSMASIVNDRLSETKTTRPLILFKVPVDSSKCKSNSNAMVCDTDYPIPDDDDMNEKIPQHRRNRKNDTGKNGCDSPNGWTTSESGNDAGSSSQGSDIVTCCSWTQWNSIRGYLNPDNRIGVCLNINQDFMTSDKHSLDRWTGEPVRMVILSTDQFLKSDPNKAIQLNTKCRDFIINLAIRNSLKTSFVIEGQPKQDITEHLQYLDYMVYNLKEQNQDFLLNWNDKIQPPLQPLSSNLDSSTYGVFEMDSMKYIKYRDAMVSAIQKLIDKNDFKSNPTFVLMVLGAGRGPLVDSMINAIETVDAKCRFKIYALDKNPSSVVSLKYKQKHHWIDAKGRYETEVVESDMRSWNPGVKADIIATELLGSLSDNELSPECIDGVWKFSTPNTISIPQEYTSYIAPICSYKMHQELSRHKGLEPNPYDQIYVVRLTNRYHISYPLQLFKFEHQDLSIEPSARCNERYSKLTFWSKVDTVCHGFAGYFMAKLFDSSHLSTLFNKPTPNMNSWFPAFIPLETPVEMPRGTKLEVQFWRKESASHVWYQWVVTNPIRSRIYTQYGLSSAMSKSI